LVHVSDRLISRLGVRFFVHIRVILAGQPPISFLDLVVAGLPSNAEHFIIVALVSCH
jgi:hypothetical protein